MKKIYSSFLHRVVSFKDTTLLDYKEFVLSKRKRGLSLRDQKLNAGLGMGESGEVQNLIKKEVFHEHPTETIKEKILDECGDELFYIVWLLYCYDYTL